MRFLLLCLLLLAPPAWAANYYVRTDGGTAAQCTGKTDAAYTGTNACAWSHPFIALPVTGTSPLVSGDVLNIRAGTYKIGYVAAGVPGCASAYPWDCYMKPVPNGVTINGGGVAKLVGVERTYQVVNLTNSSNVSLIGLEITDNLACGELLPLLPCKRDAYPFGEWASTGIAAKGAKNITMTDVNIHGLANRGISAGGIADWTLTRVKINGNAWAGWDGDVGTGSSNSGTITFIDSEIAWNGCIEGPTGAAVKCHAQNNGGYGDGMGTAATGGNWVFTNMNAHHNTSDGIDLLYATGAGKITVTGGRFEGNAGNQLKTKGPAEIKNATIIGNCAYFKDYPGLGLLAGDHCRAAGNALSIAAVSADTITLDNLTVSGQGDCLLLTSGGTAAGKFTVSNGKFTGGKDATDNTGQDLSCGWYKDGGAITYAWLSNTWASVKAGTAPANTGTAPPPVDPPVDPPVPPVCPPIPPPVVCPPVVVCPPPVVCPTPPDNSAAKAAIQQQIDAIRAQLILLEAAKDTIK